MCVVIQGQNGECVSVQFFLVEGHGTTFHSVPDRCSVSSGGS